MRPLHFVYNLIGTAVGIVAFTPAWLYHKRNRDDLERFYQRLGYYPETLRNQMHGRPRIWLHAVSVGEVGVAAAIIKALEHRVPECQIVVSTTTEQGLSRAQTVLQNRVPCFYMPIDLIGAVDRALAMVQPDILSLLETEIWPNLIIRARQRGIHTAILNGRISVRAINSYLRIRPFMRTVLSNIKAFSMISSDDARRIQSLGAAVSRISVNGNAKFDGPDPMIHKVKALDWALEMFALQEPLPPVFVAGSTREPEEQAILSAYLQLRKTFPATLLIIAPRHIERAGQIEQWAQQKGLSCQRRSNLDGANPRTAPVVILDSIGELSDIYSIASFVFCGGSLVPRGGQNLLEPAAWAKPVLYGPSMEDFADARRLIEDAGGGMTVYDAPQLAAAAELWLRRPNLAIVAGQAARQAIMAHRGAAQKHAEVIENLIQDFSKTPGL